MMSSATKIRLYAIPYALLIGFGIQWKVYSAACAIAFYGIMLAIAEAVELLVRRAKQ